MVLNKMNKKAEMFRLVCWLLIIAFMIIMSVYVVNKDSNNTTNDVPLDINDKAIKSCTDYGLKYLVHYKNNSCYQVICYQTSPLKHFWKVVN